MVDLQALQVQISDIGNQIREVKASEGGGDATKISELVAQLNTLKKEYADNNNGIGVDGKPWGGSKSEKKKDASTPVGGNAKQVRRLSRGCGVAHSTSRKICSMYWTLSSITTVSLFPGRSSFFFLLTLRILLHLTYV